MADRYDRHCFPFESPLVPLPQNHRRGFLNHRISRRLPVALVVCAWLLLASSLFAGQASGNRNTPRKAQASENGNTVPRKARFLQALNISLGTVPVAPPGNAPSGDGSPYGYFGNAASANSPSGSIPAQGPAGSPPGGGGAGGGDGGGIPPPPGGGLPVDGGAPGGGDSGGGQGGGGAPVNVTAEQGAILKACGREMGVPDGMWYPGAPCNIDKWLTCDPDGTVNGIVIRDKGISGSICSNIGLLTSLVKIDMANNSLSGSIPTSLGNLARLAVFNLQQNRLTGHFPPTMSRLASLQMFDVNTNNLYGPLLYPVGTLSNIKLINVARNNFSGSLPTSIYTLTSLQEMDVSENSLTGSLPLSASALSGLQMLNMVNNRFSGELPTTLGNLTSLTRVELGRNYFTGSLPTSLGQLTALISLGLQGNTLGGSIPSQLGALISLNTLDLSNNQLRGALPATLGNLSSLTDLKIGGTDLMCPSAAGHPPCGVWQDASSEFCQTCPAFCTNCSTAALPPKPAAAAPTSPAPAPPAAAAASLSTPRQKFIIGIAVGAAALLLLGALGIYLWFRCSSRGKPEAPPIPSQILMCRRYSLDQVKKATGGWAEANHIGTGGYGEVYKGVCPFDDSVVWAVKRAKILTNDFKREVRPFVEESKVAAFKDPLLPEASDDLILTLAKIGLQCTALPASSRPPMSEVSRKLETLKREHFHSSGMDGRDPSDVDQRLAKIDQELDRRAESGLSIQAEFVRLNIMSESGEYIKETEISVAGGGYSDRSSGVLLQSQEISQEFCQEIPSGR
ncbi:unnamed protein product [Closterium sp. NIES-65]|nr:unnamed protein product [Closterium sp. NIES-65]